MSNAKTICTVCNYIYDESLGEPSQGITAAVSFENLPAEWSCPICDSNKDMFQPCSCVFLPANEQTCVVHSAANANAVQFDDKARYKQTSVGELVAQRPSLACKLEQYGIDYCCGGKVSLEDACKTKGLNVEDVLEKLLAADSKQLSSDFPDWTKVSLKELVDHIISAYHEPLRQQLSRVAKLADKVSRVHGDNHPEMIEVLNTFNRFKAQLELHMQKEEMVLFPGIVSMEATGTTQIFGCGGGIEHPIEMMTKEHDDAGEALSTMRKLTHDYIAPEDACNTFKNLLYSLAQIESEMHQHVHKENNILFPRALGLRKPIAASF